MTENTGVMFQFAARWSLIMIPFNRCAYSSYQLSRFNKCMCMHLHNQHNSMPPMFLPWNDLEEFVLTEILIQTIFFAQCSTVYFLPFKTKSPSSTKQNIRLCRAKSNLIVIHSERSQTLLLSFTAGAAHNVNFKCVMDFFPQQIR